MEDQKGPGPKKKVLVRKSTETKEPYIAEDPKDMPLPEKVYGDKTQWSWTDAERKQRNVLPSGELSGLGVEYASLGKKLTPLTQEQKLKNRERLSKIKPGEEGYYVDKTLGYTGGAPAKAVIGIINGIAEVLDREDVTSPRHVKRYFEDPEFKEKIFKEANLNDDVFRALTKQGNDEAKDNFYYSILQQINNNREKLGPLTAKQGAIIVEPLEKMAAPESETVVRNPIDSAFKEVKDKKSGAVRMVKKD